MRDSRERELLLRLVAQLTIAPHVFQQSDAWKDALDFLDEDDVEEAVIEARDSEMDWEPYDDED